VKIVASSALWAWQVSVFIFVKLFIVVRGHRHFFLFVIVSKALGADRRHLHRCSVVSSSPGAA